MEVVWMITCNKMPLTRSTVKTLKQCPFLHVLEWMLNKD